MLGLEFLQLRCCFRKTAVSTRLIKINVQDIFWIWTHKGPQCTQQEVMRTLRYLKSSSIYLKTPSFHLEWSILDQIADYYFMPPSKVMPLNLRGKCLASGTYNCHHPGGVELVSRFHGNLSYLIKHEIKALFSRYNCGFDIDTSFRFLLHISLHISKLTEASSWAFPNTDYKISWK